MSLIMFLCDGVVSVIRLLVLTRGSNTNAREIIVDHIAFKYYGSIYLTTQSFVDQNTCINLPISLMHVLFLEDLQEVNWQKYWAYFPADKKWANYKNLVGMWSWKGSNYLKLIYTISGCRFLLSDGSYVWVLL